MIRQFFQFLFCSWLGLIKRFQKNLFPDSTVSFASAILVRRVSSSLVNKRVVMVKPFLHLTIQLSSAICQNSNWCTCPLEPRLTICSPDFLRAGTIPKWTTNLKASTLTIDIQHLQFLTIVGNFKRVHAQLLVESFSPSGTSNWSVTSQSS